LTDEAVTDRLPATPEGITEAVRLLQDGGLVAFPTDTVYGIGCHVGDADALDHIFEAKRRPPEKRIPILVASLEQAANLGFVIDERVQAAAAAFWPGALTIALPQEDGAGGSQAFRAPDHPVALELIGRAGPLATTSANRSGEPETLDADDVLIAFADTDLLAAVVDGGRVPGGHASTVLDLSVAPGHIVREGRVTREQLAAVIGPVD
jgi:L-threonylcarbamoyladenylate synthase